MPIPHLLAGDYDARAFVKLCRREQSARNHSQAKRTTEALQAAQSDPPFAPLGEDMPEMLRRLED